MKNAALNLDQLEGTMLHDPHNSHLFIYPNFFGIRYYNEIRKKFQQ